MDTARKKKYILLAGTALYTSTLNVRKNVFNDTSYNN